MCDCNGAVGGITFPNFVCHACCNKCCEPGVVAQRVDSVKDENCGCCGCCCCCNCCHCCNCGCGGNVGGVTDDRPIWGERPPFRPPWRPGGFEPFCPCTGVYPVPIAET